MSETRNIIRKAIGEVCYSAVYMGNESIRTMADCIIEDLKQSGYEITKIKNSNVREKDK